MCRTWTRRTSMSASSMAKFSCTTSNSNLKLWWKKKQKKNPLLSYLFYFVISQYELKLPIEVREGLIGTVSLNIPWNGILNQPVVLTIEVKMKFFCTVQKINAFCFRTFTLWQVRSSVTFSTQSWRKGWSGHARNAFWTNSRKRQCLERVF